MCAANQFDHFILWFFILAQRKVKYTDARLKALKAKNEYQLCLEASNTTIHKYFVEDLSDLIDVSTLVVVQFGQIEN